jgi:hypothetical protein
MSMPGSAPIASGSVMTLSAWFADQSVTICGPYSKRFHRADAEPDRFQAFCPTCGSGRFFRSGAGYPGTYGISVGSFADPQFPTPEFVLILGQSRKMADAAGRD